ncbi:1-acyl-sn-glycerol-3-phosphate acyltransferase [Bhargavaea beijingensis]|uniref:1-acyl-sn-glycerol-3-phosphate acyltransferase n=1 Tax=Bhargavaea beijingensis TaxID=426756 RepID=A0A1G7DEP9_9BACL|nr:1-acyl-sn-glycerol-3-phosphate acyltransferase [Bhargavaea beijingensis]SDE49285.1 1-acyl-sn-glycerol-3-phosphate acyltransferase [Bhargavaea beijingensis]
MNVVRSIRTYGYLFGYLPFSIPALRQVRRMKGDASPEKLADTVIREPRRWATGILRRTNSDIRMSIKGNLPDGPVLFVSNHEGNFDIPVLIAHLPKPFGFMSKEEVRKLPVIRKWMEEMNCVFVDRSDRRSAVRSIYDMAEKLRSGHSMLIFPEGTRSRGGKPGDFKSGFVRIAKEGEVPIVPVAIHGTSDIMERNNNRIRPAHVTVDVLEAISHQEILDRSAAEITRLIQDRIREATSERAAEKQQQETGNPA